MNTRRLGAFTVGLGLGFVLLFQDNTQAVGLGFYSGFGLGRQTGQDSDADSDTTLLGLGFLLDTAVARQSLFNYRLGVGYERHTEKGDGGGKTDFNLFMVDNIFGFGIVQTSAMRFWMGPELRLFGGPMKSESDNTPRNGYPASSSVSGKMLGAAVGPAFGVNFHLGEGTSLCLSGSLLYSYARVEVEGNSTYSYDERYYSYRSHVTYSHPIDYKENISGFVTEIRIGFLFRFGDQYQ